MFPQLQLAGTNKCSLSRLERIQTRLRVLVGDETFPPSNHFLTDDTSQAFRFSVSISMEGVQMNYSPQFHISKPPHHGTHIIAKHAHSIHIPLVICKFYELLPCGTNSEEIAFPITTILTLSNLGVNILMHYSTHIDKSLAFYPCKILYLEWRTGLVQGKQHL